MAKNLRECGALGRGQWILENWVLGDRVWEQGGRGRIKRWGYSEVGERICVIVERGFVIWGRMGWQVGDRHGVRVGVGFGRQKAWESGAGVSLLGACLHASSCT